ncbi:MAG: hypothetical protein PHQ00_02135 [Phycisphaerae bacterium]|nr:hypothetical protein [Phycisphaerae bacterium]
MAGRKKSLKIATAILIPISIFFLVTIIRGSRDDTKMISVIIKIINEDGEPVEGAKIKVDGYRYKWGHSMWDSNRLGAAPQVATDVKGTVKVICPKYITEKIKTKEISFSVRHREYCSARPCNYRVDGQSPPIILRKGAVVKLSAYIGSKDNVIADIVPQVSVMEVTPERSSWENDGNFLVNSQIPQGPHYLRAVYFPKDGNIYFSEAVFFEAKKGETYQFELELKLGKRLEGRVDDSVRRPVKNGRVIVRACGEEEKDSRPLWWITYRDIEDDGTFVIESLPSGKAEVIAICDGFISKNPEPDKEGTILHTGRPQIFALKNDKNEAEIEMEATANCEATVLDEKGRPIQGAQVYFSPNVEWGSGGSQIFARRTINSEEIFREAGKFDREEQWAKYKTDGFTATTDENGTAIIRNLPGYSANFEVVHLDYELPIKTEFDYGRREARAELSAGKTSTIAVVMQKKGKEFLSQSDKEGARQTNVCGAQAVPNGEDIESKPAGQEEKD